MPSIEHAIVIYGLFIDQMKKFLLLNQIGVDKFNNLFTKAEKMTRQLLVQPLLTNQVFIFYDSNFHF